MKPFSPFARAAAQLALVILFSGVALAESKPEPPPAPVDARPVITKSLGFLAREGDQWMDKKDCNGCHHMPELIWSFREAKRHGFPVDAKKFEEWLSWSEEKAPEQKGGLEEAALMILAAPDQPADALVKIITKEQRPDGTWNAGGQFSGMQARGPVDAKDASTRLYLLALATLPSAQTAADEARSKATAALAKKEPAKTVDTLIRRAMYADKFGPAEDAESLRKEILKAQRGDGGWSYNLGENLSDALATGEVLQLLGASTDAAIAPAILRARAYLTATQREDGSWLTDISHVSKVDRSAPSKASSLKAATEIYHFWGTAWATIGLLQTEPVEAPPTSTAAAD